MRQGGIICESFLSPMWKVILCSNFLLQVKRGGETS